MTQPIQPIEGMRFTVWPGRRSCRRCLCGQVRQTDAFFFRTGSRMEPVSAVRDNPFFARGAMYAPECGFDDGLTIDRSSLFTRGAESVCAHGTGAENEACEPERKGYRARSLDYFFSGTSEESFVSPVHAVIGTGVDYSLDGLVTAKASGFLIKYAEHGSYTQPWGGHRTTYRDATRLGILEGIERIGAESGAPGQVLREPPQGIPEVQPCEFGVADSDWMVSHPTVGAWIVGWELDPALPGLLSEPVALPERLVLYRPEVDTVRWVQESSNGCAIGGSDSEAILFGLLETVERDAFLIAWYGGLDLAPIDPASITDSVSRAYLRRLDLCGVRVRFLDATCGLPIPTVIAVCEEPGGSTCVGAGSNPEPEHALRSALVEVASDFQVVAAHRARRGAQIRGMLADYSRVRVMEDHADMFADPDARPLIRRWMDPGLPSVPLSSLRRIESSGEGRDLEEDLRGVVSICRAAGFAPVAVPTQTGLADSLGARCWKTVVPGLIPIDFGFDYQRALLMPRLEQAVRDFSGIGAGQEFVPVHVPHPFP